MYAEIGRLAGGSVEAKDLERARNQFLARYALESESVTDAAHQLGFFETVATHRDYLALPARVRAVTAGQVARLAAERLSERTRTVGVLVPDAAGAGGA